MKSLIKLFSRLSELNITLALDENNNLSVKGDKSALTSELLNEIKANKAHIVDTLKANIAKQNKKTITVMNRQQQTLELSFAQQRLWLLDQIEQGSVQYNMPSALRLTGALDLLIVEKAFNSIIERHESLRTTITEQADGQPQQVVADSCPIDIKCVDLSTENQATQTQLLNSLMATEAATSFDLANDLMVRAQLIKLADDEHVLLVTMHHIASDGWSVGILINEFSLLYQAYVQGENNPLVPLSVQYVDYAHWQRDWLQGEVLDQQLAYWREQLSGIPMSHSLPLDNPRPKMQRFVGQRHHSIIDEPTLTLLRQLCQQKNVTVFMALNAAFATLLARHSRQTDIVIGSPIANREQTEISDLIGYFANTLVLRTDLSESPSFNQLLTQSKTMLLDAYAHQQVPFEQIVEALQPERDMSHSPLFQVMLVLQNGDQQVLELPNLTLTNIEQKHQFAKYDLTLSAIEGENELSLSWEYSSDIFDISTIEQMAINFTTLLRALLADPEQNVFQANLLTEQEKHHQLFALNDTQVDLPKAQCIHQLFEVQVEKSPEAIAIIFESEQLTYAELNKKANQLAYYLNTERGVTADTFVGICLERSTDMVVAILAILKAGGAYVPLDPDYPETRLAYMLEDASLTTVLTQSELLKQTPISTKQAVCLDDVDLLSKLVLAPNINAKYTEQTPNNLAYVIYTSGSTGQPKGVMIEHAAASNYLYFAVKQYCQNIEGSVVSTSLNFDATLTSLFSPLCCGKYIHLIQSGSYGLEQLTNIINQSDCSLLFKVTPGQLDAMQNVIKPKLNKGLAHVFVVGGEAFTLSTLKYWQESLFKNATFVNEFGPTEATVGCAINTILPNESKALLNHNIAIGKAIANTQLYVLNENNELAPTGTIGELHIGGAGLARGYLNQIALTDEKFISNPFYDSNKTSSNKRLYKTGDLVRYLPDGNLAFLGRLDEQVKIRGFRIELGEISHALKQDINVDDATVLAVECHDDDKQLVAYVITGNRLLLMAEDQSAQAQRKAFIDELKSKLLLSLPDYMVPSHYVFLSALPLTPNGKVDHKALPDIDISVQQTAYVAPTTDTEAMLCGIWQEVLSVEQVSITDNFFELGGHSLLVMKVIASLQQANIHINARDIFSTPVLANLANIIETIKPQKIYQAPENLIPENCQQISPEMLPLVKLSNEELALISSTVPGGMANIQDIYPLGPLQTGILFTHRLNEENDPYVMPALFRLKGEYEVKTLLSGLEAIIARHDVLRTAILWQGLSEPVQIVCRDVTLPVAWLTFETAQQAEQEMRLLCSIEQQKIALDQAPLLQVQLTQVPESEEYLMILSFHHIISDHVGFDIIQDELVAYHEGTLTQQEKPAPYREFVAHALDLAKHNDAEAFFNQLLADVEEPTTPFGLSDIQGDGRQIIESTAAVPQTVALKIKQLCQKLNTSPATIFHSAWAMVIAACSGRKDVVFGTVVSGRLQGTSGAQNILGVMINTLPFRVNLTDMSASALVQQVQSLLVDLLAYEQTPLTVAQQSSGLPTNVPLFSAMLNYRHSYEIKDANGLLNMGSSDLAIELLAGQERTNYPFNLSVDDFGERFELVMQIDQSVDVERIMTYMQNALTGLVNALTDKPEQAINHLSLLSAEEQSQQLLEWNSILEGKADYPQDLCIHELFEQQALLYPEQVAVTYAGEQLSYQALNTKANQLAHYLVTKQKVTPDSFVGICLARSCDMVISILAILKAGGAYVPLDPDYPAARLSYIINNAKLDTILTSEAFLASTPIMGNQAVCLDAPAIQTQLAQALVSNLAVSDLGITSSNLAYVIYTSGSTGQPKGVMVEHNALANRIHWMDKAYDLSKDDKVLQKTPFSFDVSVWEFIWPLTVGAQLVLAKPEGHKDPNYLAELIQQAQITHLHFVPSMLSIMLTLNENDQGYLADCNSLKQVFCSGEALSVQQVKGFQNVLPDTELHNLYGPTEAAIDVSYWDCQQLQQLPDVTTVPIGRAIANIQLLILDEHLQLVPAGVAGELHISGVGLARGYLNQVALTADKFILNPFYDDANPNSSERLYKTGDLARWITDVDNQQGNIEFLGRIDHQVKIRGFRIELGEIEHALCQLDSVASAVVLATHNAIGDSQLVGFVVAENQQALVIDNLRIKLAEQLPEYMVPAQLQQIAEIPLTSNGKVDRKALLAIDVSDIQQTYVAPTSEMEVLLCDIWQDVLGVERVGITDNFFELGGHSLLAVKLSTEIQRVLDKPLSLKQLLGQPSVEQQAKYLLQASNENTSIQPLMVDMNNRYESFPLTAIQEAYWLGRKGDFELGNVGAHIYTEIPLLNFDGDKFQEVINRLIQRHDMLRMVITPDGQQQILAKVPEFQVKTYDLRTAEQLVTEQHLTQLRDELSHQLFTGEQWPLFDIRVSVMANEKVMVHYSMDALVVDASSSLLLSREFLELYQQPTKDLPKLELGFRDYVLAEQDLRASELYKKDSQYWLSRLDTLPAKPDLPLALEPSKIAQPIFERREHQLSKAQWHKLQQIAKQHQVTPTVLFLGALGQVLNRWCQQPHFTLNLTLFNRIPFHSQVDDILGDFTTLTLLEMDYRNSTLKFNEQLKQLQTQLWSDLEHRYFGGLDMQRALAAHTGQTVSYPVVVTSTLGLEQVSDDIVANVIDQQADAYAISQTSQVWLDIQVTETKGVLDYKWDSVQGLFPEAMLDDMFESMKAFLALLIDDESVWLANAQPALPVKQLALMSTVNQTQSELSVLANDLSHIGLHQGILNQIVLQQHKVAVRTTDKVLSYQELGLRSELLARQLVAGGATANELIAVVMEKGWQQVVAVLAILRAGAAYLPIDAHMPQQRIELLIASGKAKQVITTAQFNEQIPAEVLRYVITDDISDEINQQTLPVLPNNIKSSDLAYVIFTSGSTGQPKGVMIDHQGALNTVCDINQRYQVTAQDTMFGLSNLNFDLSVYDIFGVLGAGATLVLPTTAEHRDPSAWLRYFESDHDHITLWNTVPALMQILVEHCQLNKASLVKSALDLRLVLMSGDWIPTDLPQGIKEIAPNAELISLGGATEASIWSIYYPIVDVDKTWTSIPYGKALANQQFYVLQHDLTSAPIWVTGDLYIGGIGLSLGYWQDREKTDASFIKHPTTGERLYRTGDRGRLLPDGNIEFMGREDFQVKVQGYRIELGEIEAQLKSHSEINEALVTTYQVNRSNQLVAYVTGHQSAQEQIEKEAAKTQFKLANKGVRQTVTAGIDLPTIQNNDCLNLSAPEYVYTDYQQSTISITSLGYLLTSFYRKQFEGQLLPKAYYPSAGTLYPVQVYLYIAEQKVTTATNNEFIAAGYYYYQPLTHQLVLLSSDKQAVQQQKAPFELYFVADLAAISPLYGEIAEKLCRLEAGYMAQLMTHNQQSGLCVQEIEANLVPSEVITNQCQLSSQHYVLHAYCGGQADVNPAMKNKGIMPASVQALIPNVDLLNDGCRFSDVEISEVLLSAIHRKSYRVFEREAPLISQLGLLLSVIKQTVDKHQVFNLNFYLNLHQCFYLSDGLAAKSDSGNYLSSGTYHYDSSVHQLTLLTKDKADNLFTGENHQIENGASFSLFIAAKPNTDIEQGLYQAGLIGQLISNYASQASIGLCAMGKVNESQVMKAFQLSEQQPILHSFIGGRITEEQILNVNPSLAPNSNLTDALIQYLRSVLPEYMVPKHFVALDKLPLTSNSKVDRKALPIPASLEGTSDYVAPQTLIEQQLCEIWQSVLGVNQVSMTDDFFLLGGHSLLAITMIGQLKNTFAVSIKITDLYAKPSVKELSELITSEVNEMQKYQDLTASDHEEDDMEEIRI